MSSVDSAAPPAIAPPSELPGPRGPITERLLASLRRAPHDITWKVTPVEADDEEDLHLALYCCYELHYQGLAAVDPDWEWEPSLLAIRRELEGRFLADLHETLGPVQADAATVPSQLWEMATGGDGPSLSGWVSAQATLEHIRELAIHRCAYQLKEADPHTWAIPRLSGQAKAAMVAIQADEYGGGVTSRMHSSLFSQTMLALGLDPTESYLDLIPGVTLATTNLMSMLGLHRRWRGALVGHLALFEMTSVTPMGRYAQALRRLGVAEGACQFYEAHVEADQVHQHLAVDGMVAGLLRHEPDLATDVIFGAASLDALEARFSRYVLEHWEGGRSSLRQPASGRVPTMSRRNGVSRST